MKSKNFVVTGANSSLGKILIECFATIEGVQILAVSRSKLDSNRTRNHIVCIDGIDLLDSNCLARLRAKAVEVFPEGTFNVINCIGSYWEHFSLEEASLELCQKVIRENFETVFNVGHTLLPIMRERTGGHFIGFGCNSTRHHYPHMAPYTASKQAVATFMKSICNEYGRWNIQANCFLLSTLQTERERETKPYGDHEKWLDPHDIAEAVWSLIDQSSIIVNGSEIELLKYSDQYNWKGYFERIRKH